MSSCITRSGEVWVTDDVNSRERLDDTVYSAIGNTKENLDGFPLAISKIVVDYVEDYRCFGERQWAALCERVDPAPFLPDDFFDIWNGPCPIYSGKKVRETHMLVYIPATADGMPFTLKKLAEIAKRFFPHNNKSFRGNWSGVFDKLGDKSIDESRWVLMTKDVLPKSRNKRYPEQQKIVTKLAKKSLGYKIPGTLEAAACILAQYFDSGTRLFNDEPWTYTRCEEEIQGCPTMVGAFTMGGLVIDLCCDYKDVFIGVAALRKP